MGGNGPGEIRVCTGAKTPKNSLLAPPVRHSEIGIKLKLIVYILIIHLLLFM